MSNTPIFPKLLNFKARQAGIPLSIAKLTWMNAETSAKLISPNSPIRQEVLTNQLFDKMLKIQEESGIYKLFSKFNLDLD